MSRRSAARSSQLRTTHAAALEGLQRADPRPTAPSRGLGGWWGLLLSPPPGGESSLFSAPGGGSRRVSHVSAVSLFSHAPPGYSCCSQASGARRIRRSDIRRALRRVVAGQRRRAV